MQLSLPTAPPPRRAALQERSESHTNERASPTLRMIGNPQAPTYGSSPFPTKPSHILLPKGYSDGASALQAPVDAPRGLNLPVEKEYDVGDFTSAATSHTARTRPEPKETDDASTTTRSLADASFYTPVQAITARLNDGITSSSMDQATNDNSRVSGDIVQLPSVYPGPDVTTYPNSNARDTSAHYPLSKDSDTSLSSSNSTGTVIVRKVREGRKRASYSAFPNTARQGSSKSDDSIHTPPDPMAKDLGGRASPVSPISASSPVDPDIHENRNSSAFLYANFEPASQSSVNLQYPVIRPPSASASWVEHPFPEPRRPPRTERTVDRWNPHLSTVPSESTGSQSEERNSQSIWLPDSSRMSKASYIPINARGSSDLPPIPVPPPSRPDSDLPPLTNRALIPPRDVTGSTIRVVNEQEDDLSNMRPLIPGSSGSQFLGVTPGDKRGSVVTKPGSKASFFRDSIPAWARCFIPLTYYSRPMSATSTSKSGPNSRASTSTENVSLNMSRPRTRNRDAINQRRSSLAIVPVRPRELDLTALREIPRRRISSSWSPHLWHDRNSLARRAIFQAPDWDYEPHGSLSSKRTTLMLLFAVGFIFPPAWFIAAFLPLPPRPELLSAKGKEALRRTQIAGDLEKQLGPIDEGRYENARWWRNINRIMCGFGIIIVVAIITLAAVAAS